MRFSTIALALASGPTALAGNLHRRGTYGGVATFNDYSIQGNTVCGHKAGKPGTYGAASGDYSPDISPGHCGGTVDTSLCDSNGNVKDPNYQGPACSVYRQGPPLGCGQCFKVVNNGSIDPNSPVDGQGRQVIVQIIDACPKFSAYNYCKSFAHPPVPPEQRCGSTQTDALDIDITAYEHLTGKKYQSGVTPNLKVIITTLVSCP